MNPLVNKSVKTALGFTAGLLIAWAIDKYKPLKKKDGTPLVLSPAPASRTLLIGLATAGTVLLYFVGRILKINFLKS